MLTTFIFYGQPQGSNKGSEIGSVKINKLSLEHFTREKFGKW